MTAPTDELVGVSVGLKETVAKASHPEFAEPLTRLEAAANQVGKSWSGSCIGHHAVIYYDKYQPPPEGAHFSVEWGTLDTFTNTETTGEWHQFPPDHTREFIFRLAGVSDLTPQRQRAQEATRQFEAAKAEILSILQASTRRYADSLLAELQTEAKACRAHSVVDFRKLLLPPAPAFSRDSEAMARGRNMPPHLEVMAEVGYLRAVFKSCDELGIIAERAASHTRRVEGSMAPLRSPGDRIFIGHGRSAVWRDLKEFVQDRLKLPWDEFNRVPVAGITNTARLTQMMESAAFAFLVLTAEDEQADGTLAARMNVVHEAGLFQGRLGFTRAIILLEDGCETFSNIHGLGQLRFPSGNIAATFEEIRRVIEREGLPNG